MLSLETSRAVRANAGGLQHLCAEIWVAEEGLAEKGTERRLDLIFQRCITVRGNISVDCQGMTLSGMKLLIFLSKIFEETESKMQQALKKEVLGMITSRRSGVSKLQSLLDHEGDGFAPDCVCGRKHS